MYIPPSFRLDDEKIQSAIETYPFATLISISENEPMVNFAPLLYDASKHQLLGHLANSNSQISVMRNNPKITVIFHGPEGYISPNWYQDRSQVPTWNFLNIEVKGNLSLIESNDEKLQLLARLSDHHEHSINSDWAMSKVPEPKLMAMLGAITGFAISIETWEGKAKLSQNKSEVEQQNVIRGLENLSDHKSRLLAEQMNSNLLK